MNRSVLIALLMVMLACLNGSPGELPVETFFRNYQYSEVRISPEGDYLAALAPIKERVGLVVISLKDLKINRAFAEQGEDVAWFNWASNNRLLFRLAKDGYARSGLFAVNRDGSKAVPLVRLGDHHTHLLSLLPNSTNEILVTTFAFSERDAETGFHFADVDRMNVLSGEMTREVTNPGHVVRWVVDHEGQVRLGITVEDMRHKVLYRTNKSAAWQTIAEFGSDDDDNAIEPIIFEYDNKTLLVRHYGGEQMAGIYTFDVDEKKVKTLAFRHAQADPGTLWGSGKSRKVLGVTYETERPEVFWFDTRYKMIQASVDRALPYTINSLISRTRDERKLVFLAANDRTPGTTYLLDTTTMKMQKLFHLAEWINPDEMAEMKPIQYAARDGLVIHGYLTLPKGSSGKNLPLIVNPHGGPILRDTWGFDPEVQFLANRGYAVLRMNFRGSTGYGKDFIRAGFKEWGSKQQDDITDGVKWAIKEGIANPQRICIFGASYGGYAALVGLEQTPELYRCGISYAGVTDVIRTIKKMEEGNLPFLSFVLAQHIGDRKTEKDRLEAISPLRQVDKVQVPVFMANGGLDPKVPISTGRDMAKALKKRGKLFDFMVKEEEGHGFYKEQNKIDFWRKVDEFLKANLN